MRKTKTTITALVLSLALSFLLFTPNTFAEVTGDPEFAPSDISLSEIMVNENAANGTFIANISAVDPDNAAEELTFFIPSDAGERFTIVDGNKLKVLSGNEYLDYETNTTHDITILVRDPDWNTYDEIFTILVQNRNEAPTDILFDSTAVDERAEAGTLIGTLTAVDPDSGDSFVYTLTDNSDGRFEIVNGNQVVVLDGVKLLAESYDILVHVVDAVGNAFDKYLSVDVNPIQAPILSGIVIGVDEDGDTTLAWTTDKDAKSRVDYGMVGNMTELTFFTKNYALEQDTYIPDLMDCVTYEYRPRSSDRFGKERLGETGTFTTDGCEGGAITLAKTQSTITPAEGGKVQLLNESNKGVIVNVPTNFIETEEDVQVQLKRLEVGAVLQSIGIPDDNMYVVGTGVYDLQVISDITTKIPTFQKDMELEFSYTDGSISMIDESTISVLRWNGTYWASANGGCIVDELNNTVTCKTSEFSTFAVFGYMNEIAQSFSGKAKTIRRRGMAREDFRGVAVEGGINKSNFDVAYQKSLDEIAMINAGNEGGAQTALNDGGEKVFLGYKAGRSGTEQMEDRIVRRTNVAYRGSSARSSAMLAQQDVSLKKRLASMKGGLLAKSSMQRKIDEEKKMALAMASKFDQTKSLLQMYQVASAEMALCLNQNAGFCDEIYRYLAAEIAEKEKEMIDHLMMNWTNE
jgi:hypothetical protein